MLKVLADIRTVRKQLDEAILGDTPASSQEENNNLQERVYILEGSLMRIRAN